jgi:Family of unknown function (DUF6221)
VTADPLAWVRAEMDAAEKVAREAAMAVGRTGYENGVLVEPVARWGDDLAADGQHWVSNYATVKRQRTAAGEKGRTVAECGGFGTGPIAAHVARHDPAAVLRRIKAERKALDECEEVLAVDGWEYDDAPTLAATVIRGVAEGWGWTEEK